jgi:hypothetical protein
MAPVASVPLFRQVNPEDGMTVSGHHLRYGYAHTAPLSTLPYLPKSFSLPTQSRGRNILLDQRLHNLPLSELVQPEQKLQLDSVGIAEREI